MSEYYGGVKGNRGEATRMGHKTSGLTAYAKSWKSKVTVNYYWNEIDKITMVSVTVENEDRKTIATLFDGPEDALLTYGKVTKS